VRQALADRISSIISMGPDVKILDALRDRLTRNPRAGVRQNISDTINAALTRAGLMRQTPLAREHDPRAGIGAAPAGFVPDRQHDVRTPALARFEHAGEKGAFLVRSFTGAAGTRQYKLYVPSRYSAHQQPMPLMVMLHGCTQSPDDFAAGTRMNDLAEEYGFLVAYPAQATNANGSKCWNWFRPGDQRRDDGEPSLIAGIAREVAAEYRVDEGRVFVAGLSAGAAMAVVLGATYPDVFAAVGAHSGLPFGAAHDVPSAFQAMRNPGAAMASAPIRRGDRSATRMLPVIVFHGDRDATVDIGNGAAIVQQTLAGLSHATQLQTTTSEGRVASGRTFTRNVHADGSGRPIVEDWVLHGAGHA
jgi:poly(hydroxyalkanoate) depolymerase family esterase